VYINTWKTHGVQRIFQIPSFTLSLSNCTILIQIFDYTCQKKSFGTQSYDTKQTNYYNKDFLQQCNKSQRSLNYKIPKEQCQAKESNLSLSIVIIPIKMVNQP
jgi:hypothetical protein